MTQPAAEDVSRAGLRSTLSPLEADLIATAMVRALQQARSVSDSEHFDHHRWISEKIKTEQWRAQFWKQMVEHVAKWGVISVISALVYAFWLGFKVWSKRNGF